MLGRGGIPSVDLSFYGSVKYPDPFSKIPKTFGYVPFLTGFSTDFWMLPR